MPVQKKGYQLTESDFDEIKKLNRHPYLTEAKFFEWVNNHFIHLDRKVTYISGGLVILIPLLIAIFIKIFFG